MSKMVERLEKNRIVYRASSQKDTQIKIVVLSENEERLSRKGKSYG